MIDRAFELLVVTPRKDCSLLGKLLTSTASLSLGDHTVMHKGASSVVGYRLVLANTNRLLML